MGVAWSGSNGGADWELTLASDRLLPGRLAEGRVSVTAGREIDARALVVTLRGEEKWRYNVSDGKNTTIHTGSEDQPPVAVVVSGPVHLAPGATRSFAVSMPVPSLGPATLDGREASMTWSLEAKLDIPNGTDSALEVPVRVAQPVALLRAGVVHVGEFALYEHADARGGGVAGSVEVDPVPIVAGEPFQGRLVLRPSGPVDVEEVRLEIRVRIESTVGGGRNETITPFAAAVSGPLRLDGEHVLEMTGRLEDLALPTIELEHGKASAQIHVILARRLARDPHLVRDVAIATTSEL